MQTHLPTATGLSISPVQLTQIHGWLWKELLPTMTSILCTHTCTQTHMQESPLHRDGKEIGSVMAHIIIIPILMLDFGKSGVVDHHENIITFGINKKSQIQTTLSFLCTYTLLFIRTSKRLHYFLNINHLLIKNNNDNATPSALKLKIINKIQSLANLIYLVLNNLSEINLNLVLHD